jgi:hypothetical protein
MRFKKSSPEIVARFADALPASSLVEQNKMFGYPSAFVRGNYFAGLFEESVVLRLPEPLRGKLPELAHAAVFDPMRTGKGMRDWLVIPAKVASNAHALAALLEAALPLVATLPPKAKKPRKRPKKGD